MGDEIQIICGRLMAADHRDLSGLWPFACMTKTAGEGVVFYVAIQS